MDVFFTYALIAVVVVYFAAQVIGRWFDPFAPIWLFLVGYFQVYVVQPFAYREWALVARGPDLVTAAGARALWALLLFLAVYHSGLGGLLARALPAPPRTWSPTAVSVLSPLLIVWGLICSGVVLRMSAADPNASPEAALLLSFPFVMLVGAVLLIVTGRDGDRPRRPVLALGLSVAALYVIIWMFNGKRSHSLMGVMSSVCAFYISKGRRPSWPVIVTTALTGALVVALAIGWRWHAKEYGGSFSGFVRYVGDFDPSLVLECFNIESETKEASKTRETEEWGGFLLMLDTVPEKSDYDYGAPYLRIVSTFIPRIVWRDKPLFGREQWINAWIAGSEMKRNESFTGPAIGLLGATQLNGGAWGTAIALSGLALAIRTGYEFFRRHADNRWAQCWWSVMFFNAWFMVVNDDPMVWFYYNWGFTAAPSFFLLWCWNHAAGPRMDALPVVASTS